MSRKTLYVRAKKLKAEADKTIRAVGEASNAVQAIRSSPLKDVEGRVAHLAQQMRALRDAASRMLDEIENTPPGPEAAPLFDNPPEHHEPANAMD
jgi:hypothetical protein